MEEYDNVVTLDQSNADGPTPPTPTEIFADYETRKWCLINAGSLVASMPGFGIPYDVIKVARDFYLFMVSEDPVVDEDFDEDDDTNVIQMSDHKKDIIH